MRDSNAQLLLNKKLPELATLERLIKVFGDKARVTTEAVVRHGDLEFPIHSLVLGTEDRKAPTLALFGGVHGLERIGSEVLISWLQTISEVINWDETFRERLKNSRLVFMPIVNPVGMYLRRRSNGNHVDLMRNSPVDAEGKTPFLLGGQTYTKILPWYRGETARAETLEVETKAIEALVEREVFPSKLSMSVDVHSGFGSVDRFWFPYARTVKPPPHVSEITALKRLFDRSYPNHFYQIEPQAVQYTTHGDVWDWLYDRKLARGGGVYLPWTLELGSWLWLKKNPRQVFSSLGAFHPLKAHRLQRILRRHLTLFDFLHRALLSPGPWLELEDETRDQLKRRAMDLWYEPKA